MALSELLLNHKLRVQSREFDEIPKHGANVAFPIFADVARTPVATTETQCEPAFSRKIAKEIEMFSEFRRVARTVAGRSAIDILKKNRSQEG